MIRRTRATRMATLLLLAPLAVAGCGDLTAGGLGEAETFLAGDAQDAESTSSRQPSTTALAGAAPDTDGNALSSSSPVLEAVGNVTATAEVWIRSPEGEWVPLTEGLTEATVDIEGGEESLNREQLEPGIYSRVRVRFTDIQAQVEEGLPVLGTITVDFGEASSVTVERQVELDLADGDAAEVLIDLNSVDWLSEALPREMTVEAAHVRSAVEVRVR